MLKSKGERTMAKKYDPKVRQDSAQRNAENLVSRLNGGQVVAGSGESANKLITRIAKGGRTGNAETDAFVRALSSTSKPKTEAAKTGPLQGKISSAKKGGKDKDTGGKIASDLLDALTDKNTAIRPKAKKDGGHRGTTLVQDDRSLTDGFSPDSYQGPAEPKV
jgi:hypothetical protein